MSRPTDNANDDETFLKGPQPMRTSFIIIGSKTTEIYGTEPFREHGVHVNKPSKKKQKKKLL